jgi:hypothetical protein
MDEQEYDLMVPLSEQREILRSVKIKNLKLLMG